MPGTILRWAETYKWRIILSVLIITFSALLAFEPHVWIFDAMDSLRIPYAIGLTIFTMITFIRNNKMLATSSAIALCMLAPGLWKYFKPEQPAIAEVKQAAIKKDDRADFSVLHFNVKENNKNVQEVANAALNSGADVLSFQEVHENTLNIIDKTVSPSYPYHLSDISIKGFGMAVYSKYPIEQRNVIVEKNFPILTGVIQVGDRAFHFISATTSTPTNEKDFDAQRRQFKFMADYANKIDSPLVVMGDMNSVPWSAQIEGFVKETKLRDSRKDLAGTFPANSIFQIPIDYIFHSDDISCISFGTLAQSTSNHLGIMGNYTFTGTKPSKQKKLFEKLNTPAVK